MKNYKKILAFVLALTMVAALFTGCAKQEEIVEEPAEAPSELPMEDVTEAPAGEPAPAHHINAYGLPSYSIHYAADTSSFDYMNEAGELVSVSEEEVMASMDAVIGTCGDYTLTNKELTLCYQDQYYQFYQTYGMYMMFMLDTSKGLDEQLGNDGVNTWQHAFLDMGAQSFHRMAAVSMEAKAQGFDTAEAMTMVEQAKASLEDSAAQLGYEDVDKFLADSLPGITMESYLAYMELQAVNIAYTKYLQEQQTVTEEELEAYYAENEESLAQSYPKIDKNVVNVRHILVKPEETTAEDGTTSISEEAWAAAEAQAQTLYDQWKSGEATEDSFAELATANTQDPGSQQTGGLYEDVYPGQMVAEFNDWCFAEGRAVGDHGIVKTSYGYHIMFFAGEGDYIYWKQSVEDMVISQRVNDEVTNLQAKYPMDIDLTKAVIVDTVPPTVPTEETPVEEVPVEEHVHTEECEHEAEEVAE